MMSGDLSYRTHILIGIRPKGVMTVIAHWPHVPKQPICNVAHRQNLGNDFYRVFLDEGMNYLCAYFGNDSETLTAIQPYPRT